MLVHSRSYVEGTKINDNDMKKEQLVTVLQDRALTWYIKYSTTNPKAMLVETKTTMNA